MMPLQLAPDFDGQKWRCSCCGSCLATVIQAETIDLQSLREGVLTGERRRVAALELPRGFVFHKGRGVWLKPIKLLPSNRGAQNATDRRRKDAFTRAQLERAMREGDPASKVEAQHKLRHIEERQHTPSKPACEGAAPRLFASQLPASIRCSKADCERVFRLDAVGGRA